MKERLDSHRLSNGMIILGEPMADVESASFYFLLPAGNAYYPEGCSGAGQIITDWLFRGAGSRDSRTLIEALDELGIHRNSSITAENLSISASLESANLLEALDLYADILTAPLLDDEQFEPSRQLAVHELAGLDDDPQHKVRLLVAEQFYPAPYNRPSEGKKADLESMTADSCRRIIQRQFDWSQGIFAIAGKYDFPAICDLLEKRCAHLPGTGAKRPAAGAPGQRYTHEANEGAQVHIGLMTRVPTIQDSRYYDIMAAVSILSGGMSSRLFTEVREKRGLCYAVGARYQSLKDHAAISCYAGTTPEQAQETLDVTVEQFRRLREGFSDEELQRAQIGLKSTLIMQSESSAARAAGVAGDYYYLGRVRTLPEIRQKIDSVSRSSVLAFLNDNPFDDFTVATIGPKPIQL
ncbi:MAG: insulinase family protein [Sedimentisphaerales bacterium]|nr:insulinase family protein [Sedimentisphaerales bacterium]